MLTYQMKPFIPYRLRLMLSLWAGLILITIDSNSAQQSLENFDNLITLTD
jgi:hypothetical protein